VINLQATPAGCVQTGAHPVLHAWWPAPPCHPTAHKSAWKRLARCALRLQPQFWCL